MVNKSKSKNKHDDKEDFDLVAEYEARPKGFKSISKKEKEGLIKAAKVSLEEEESKRITIRLSQDTLTQLKELAAQEGLPYQTMIQSLLHKIVTNQLVPRILLEDRDKKIEKMEMKLHKRKSA